MRIRFAHAADCHLGGWREEKINRLNLDSFKHFIDKCIEEKEKNNLDFVIIVGDLFDVALPSIDILKFAAEQLKRLKDKNITCYISAGSHDFSVSGKTMLSVLSNAGLFHFLGEKESVGVTETENCIFLHLTGKKSSLELNEIEKLNEIALKIKDNNKIKIALLHTTIEEFLNDKAEFMDSIKAELLPPGFDYYAAGHLHNKQIKKIGEKIISYSGALFPDNFEELEKLRHGWFNFVEIDTEKADKVKIEEIPVKLADIIFLDINAENKNIEGINKEIEEKLKKEDLKEKILMLKISGELEKGNPSEVDFKNIKNILEEKEGLALLRNISKLTTKDFEIKVDIKSENVEDIEKELIEKHFENEEREISLLLIECFDKEKEEGELNRDFEERLLKEVMENLNLKSIWEDVN
ncbi:hypothetical protein AUJ10_01960 [Candidatus Pacearchaeota archaeon CG1_02_31_27]|nr:MAG: hypothetical protein AUJ10_01960 [Candidatus Pacearchaeota archaeon CG1_02_31_27]